MGTNAPAKPEHSKREKEAGAESWTALPLRSESLFFSPGSYRLSSGLPVVWMSMKMHDRKDVNAIGLNAVQNTVWKAID